ncbi:phospho-N-acetylmuramoyl-pentapeptide-transferase [Rugosimonospora africana]|uniref:Phospho-N-acetylmuramoyl-pentapeptide-transferase n=1 Tax=Rugosimonospora africana TaxID=556532 RepID=A0A8J3R0D4_9ACTN|nr:phospho-N-acetylmuramoyl-pentapeptide-transferase [Rugosimonospora africana]GIH19055.1 phospho-N-acetylmuramoyl-pentapeptide-transferase [Rugosimonospora africana]
MRSVIVAACVAFVLSLFGTPFAIRGFTKLKAAQPIRDINVSHSGKRGTPTMGGVVFIVATVVAYFAGHLVLKTLPDTQIVPPRPTVTGLVLLGLMVFCGGIGFIDDFLKVRKRNSLGLNKRGKLILQVIVGAVFGIVALYFPATNGQTVASTDISFVRDIHWLNIGKVAAVVLFVAVIMSTTNGVNLTDGLDGLATGASVMVIGGYMLIAFWQYRHWCADTHAPGFTAQYCYQVRDPLEIGLIAGAAAGALLGFLWWNASPARIFMGDTGSMALGGLIGGLAISTRTELLLLVMGLLFVIITMSLIIQIISFRTTGKRVFRMSPLHHHFELAGWSEVNIVIRFWIIAGIGVTVALGLFYGDFLRNVY